MFFQIKDDIQKINLQNIDQEILTLGIITFQELESCYQFFGFSDYTVAECRNEIQHMHGTIDVYNDYLFGIMIGINARQIIRVQDRMGIYIKQNLFLIVIIEDQDDSIRTKLFEALDHLNLSKISLGRLIYAFLERLISGDYVLLEKIEHELCEQEDKINDNKPDKYFNHRITNVRKKLLMLNNYYEQLIGFGEELEENEIDLFDEVNLHFFKLFTDRVTRLSNNTRTLQAFSVHVREAYHAQMDNNLNGIMKMFTVVTTIFLPLTLIVGWYGMNFTHMPELTWRYGYLFVILLSLLVAIGCLIFFKKKKFL